MNKKFIYQTLLPFLLLSSSNKDIFAFPNTCNKPYEEDTFPKAKGLSEYECNGHFFYAHNDNEALKRAKKKGYWSEGAIINKVE